MAFKRSRRKNSARKHFGSGAGVQESDSEKVEKIGVPELELVSKKFETPKIKGQT